MAKYDLAISFAGEQRRVADFFARRLDASGYSIFFDEFAQAELLGRDLSLELGDVYANQARYCLCIVSAEYVRKAWPNLERQHAIGRFMRSRSDYILCLRTDDSHLPGLPDVIGYLSLASMDEAEVYGILLQKLGPPNHDNQVSHLSLEDRTIAERIIRECYRRAVFTKMESEIGLDAMRSSFAQILRLVQPLTAQIHDPALQYNALAIVGAIDEIERIVTRSGVNASNDLKPQLACEIDRHKITIIDALLKMRRSAQLAIQLPFALRIDHFIGLQAANEPPEAC